MCQYCSNHLIIVSGNFINVDKNICVVYERKLEFGGQKVMLCSNASYSKP